MVCIADVFELAHGPTLAVCQLDPRRTCLVQSRHEARDPVTAPAMFFNPFDPAVRADPYPHYRDLRERIPVHRTPIGSVVVTRYDDVARTLRGAGFSRDIEANATEGMRIDRRDPTQAKSLLQLDPPDHTRLRRLATAPFTPRAIDRLRPSIEAFVDAGLDRMAADGGGDLVDLVAFPVPFAVISAMLDIPTDRADELRHWSLTLTAGIEPMATPDELAAAADASAAMRVFLTDVITKRRANLSDDILSGLISAEESGDRLSTDELVSLVLLLYVAGHETTVNLIGNSALALIGDPEQLGLWRADPSIGPGAVDELMRHQGPVHMTARVAMEATSFPDVDGNPVDVAPGTVVTCLLASADRDPAMFEDPDRLDLRRPDANRHLGFSAGAHYCLGASLARKEAEVALARLFQRFDRVELAGEPVRNDRLTLRGLASLPLSVG